MKRILLYLIVLAIFTANLAYSQDYVEDTITVNRTLDAPYIDGYADGYEWDTESYYTITEWGEDEDGNPIAPDPSDCTAKFKMLWDDDYIYFLGVVVDDTIATKDIMTFAGAAEWESDSWEFYIAPTLSKLPSMEEEIQVRLAFANQNSEDASAGVTNGYSEGNFYPEDFVTGARLLTDSGWVLEASFALAPIAAAAEVGVFTTGSLIGWNMAISDSDGETYRDWIGQWIPHTTWNQADTLGILKLGADTTGLVPVDTGNVGIDKIQAEAEISFYPNPVAGELRYSGGARIETIEIINILGDMVLRKSDVKNRIDVSNLRAGVYLVKAYSNGEMLKSHKFVKK